MVISLLDDIFQESCIGLGRIVSCTYVPSAFSLSQTGNFIPFG